MDTSKLSLIATGRTRRVYDLGDYVLKEGLQKANETACRLARLFPEDVPETWAVDGTYNQIVQRKITPLTIDNPVIHSQEFKVRFEYLAARYRDASIKNLGLLGGSVMLFDAGSGREDKIVIDLSLRSQFESTGWRVVRTESHPDKTLRLKMARVY